MDILIYPVIGYIAVVLAIAVSVVRWAELLRHERHNVV